eukprot:scaffold480897_cov37-Prasinocladus_malaysianus.AAC.1
MERHADNDDLGDLVEGTIPPLMSCQNSTRFATRKLPVDVSHDKSRIDLTFLCLMSTGDIVEITSGQLKGQ